MEKNPIYASIKRRKPRTESQPVQSTHTSHNPQPQTEQTHLISAPASEVNAPLVEFQAHVPHGVCDVPAHEASLLPRRLRDGLHVELLPRVVLDAAQAHDGDAGALLLDDLAKGRSLVFCNAGLCPISLYVTIYFAIYSTIGN